MALSVDLSKPLISKLIVNGRVQLVEYESLPVICFHCGRYGHAKEGCPDLRHNQPPSATEPIIPPEAPSNIPTASESFGPWMVATRRTRKPSSTSATAKVPNANNFGQVSRFQPIFVSESDDTNVNFAETFPESTVHHLLRSSHFRYFSGWKSHSDFSRMVVDNWKVSSSMSVTLQRFVRAADTWNKTIFGYVGTKKRTLMARLRGIQKSLSCHPSRFLCRLESELLVDLEHLLDQEELLWRQKSRFDWVSLGDRNTRYFHRRAICRKQRSMITTLMIRDGSWCDDDDTLMSEAVEFFKNLFDDTGSSPKIFPVTNSFPQLSDVALRGLDSAPLWEEIYSALMEMAPLKSPGWDGLHAEFFNNSGQQWGNQSLL
ncbi:hypothetical protein V6N13_093714 [Hibiscus sabdariffa]